MSWQIGSSPVRHGLYATQHVPHQDQPAWATRRASRPCLIACSQEPTGNGSGKAEQPAAQTSKTPQATLTSWRNNRDRIAAVAKGNPRLEAALPISADIAALAGIGLDASAAIESGRAPASDWRSRAKELLDRHAAAEKASASIVEVITMQQPTADLLISITPGVRRLVDAAVSLRP